MLRKAGLKSVLLWGAIFGISGCHEVVLSDSIRMELFHLVLPWEHQGDALHSPYVQGARFRLTATTTDHEEDLTGWRIESDDSGVLRILSQDGQRGSVSAECTAEREGTAVIQVYDARGRLRRARRIEVLAPDRVELHGHGPLLIGESLEQTRVGEARILRGGTATYLVRYFRGQRPLNGHGALTVDVAAGVHAEPRQTYFLEEQEWLSLTPSVAGEKSLVLRAGGASAGSMQLVGVDDAEISRVVLEGEDEGAAHKGEWLSVIAYGLDARGRPLRGIDFDWTLEGVTQESGRWLWEEEPEVHDLFQYDFVAGVYKTLTATHGGHSATAMIHAGHGFVSSTNRLGCGAAPGSPATGGLLALLLVGLLALRRRRSRASAPQAPRA